jgi:hypothetical protein
MPDDTIASYLALFDMGTRQYTRALEFETFEALVYGMAKPGETYEIHRLHFPPGPSEPIREFIKANTKL